MKIKEMLLLFLSMASLIACTNSANNVTNNEDRDAMQILEEKREYYEELDKKKAKEAKGYQVEMTAEEAETETEDEKLMYKVDKAKEKIDNMLDIAKKARQEEIDVEETKNQVEEALKNITEEK